MNRPQPDPARPLVDAMRGRRVAVLTGAGCSTRSGIPDYRGPRTRHIPRRPIQHREFVEQPAARQRYWARSVVGWPRLAAARPNPGHRALAALESAGIVTTLLTQNVDGLHQAAGSRAVVELHGALSRVRCLQCGVWGSRDALQERLLALNPAWRRTTRPADGQTAPDGDVELSDDQVAGFQVAGCPACDGVLMPDVVFFGGAVPRRRVQDAFDRVAAADVLLVVGSSLTVFSGYRFVRAAHAAGQPVLILNQGETRGDPLATHKVDACCTDLLPRVAQELSGVAA